ncbi:MAG: protein kinase [Propionibacteriaceae bacterium]|nr:protein kinase [Propionibacteriaceae bacterium]
MGETLIGNRYLLGTRLSKGGMSVVYRARDTSGDSDVAIKLLKADLAEDPIFQRRFRREVQALVSSSHPNTVAVIDSGDYFDDLTGLMIPYLVMELLIGNTLRELLASAGKPPLALGFDIMGSVLAALGHCHSQGIIHRDIKPSNVMVTRTGPVKVLDFGIARIKTMEALTLTGAVAGTAHYLAPEQIEGAPTDGRSDLYGAGCLMYELLTGRPPFLGITPMVVAQHLHDAPVPPSAWEPELTEAVDAVCLKTLAKQPIDRYQTAEQLQVAIEIARATLGDQGRRVRFFEPTETGC